MGLRSAIDLAAAVSQKLAGARVEHLRQLSGGASRETWSFDALSGDGRQELVLQRQQNPGDDVRLGLATQAALLRAARAAGVPVAEVIGAAVNDQDLGDWMIIERISGETIPRKILRDDSFAAAREGLAASMAIALARIHSIPRDAVPEVDTRDEFETYRRLFYDLGEAHPAFELAFRELERTRPPASERVVVHGDYRNGNFIVDHTGLRAVIDWELAHVGDRLEDIGWLCVKSWRFGGALPAGGFCTREDLFDAYEKASGTTIDPVAALWWEAFGTLRWGIICIVQAMRHLSGAERSVELATIGRRVAEVEYDLMGYLP